MPLKMKPPLFISCLNRTNNTVSLIIEPGEKNFVLLFLWSDNMDIETIEVFQNSYFGGTDLDCCSYNQLLRWQKTDVIRRLLIKFF